MKMDPTGYLLTLILFIIVSFIPSLAFASVSTAESSTSSYVYPYPLYTAPLVRTSLSCTDTGRRYDEWTGTLCLSSSSELLESLEIGENEYRLLDNTNNVEKNSSKNYRFDMRGHTHRSSPKIQEWMMMYERYDVDKDMFLSGSEIQQALIPLLAGFDPLRNSGSSSSSSSHTSSRSSSSNGSGSSADNSASDSGNGSRNSYNDLYVDEDTYYEYEAFHINNADDNNIYDHYVYASSVNNNVSHNNNIINKSRSNEYKHIIDTNIGIYDLNNDGVWSLTELIAFLTNNFENFREKVAVFLDIYGSRDNYNHGAQVGSVSGDYGNRFLSVSNVYRLLYDMHSIGIIPKDVYSFIDFNDIYNKLITIDDMDQGSNGYRTDDNNDGKAYDNGDVFSSWSQKGLEEVRQTASECTKLILDILNSTTNNNNENLNNNSNSDSVVDFLIFNNLMDICINNEDLNLMYMSLDLDGNGTVSKEELEFRMRLASADIAFADIPATASTTSTDSNGTTSSSSSSISSSTSSNSTINSNSNSSARDSIASNSSASTISNSEGVPVVDSSNDREISDMILDACDRADINNDDNIDFNEFRIYLDTVEVLETVGNLIITETMDQFQ